MLNKNEKESTKIKLEEIKVQSFTTSLSDEEKLMIKGGNANTWTNCTTSDSFAICRK